MIGYLTANHPLIRAFQSRPTRRVRRESLADHRVFLAAPTLSDYFNSGEIVAVKGELDRRISGLAIDSRRVVPGNVFFALPGLNTDGASFIDEAVSRGAVAVVTQKMPSFPPSKVTFIRVADPRAALARVAQRYYKSPDRDMTVIGVTGTAGKTTVAHLLKHLLNAESRVGLLSTIHYDLGARTVPSYRTTPEALDVFGLMAQMRDAGCRHAVMEVSSHGLEQKRVFGMQFGAAVFTNLSHDHLDYHGTIEEYFEVKTRLFTGENGIPPRVAVVNLDDPFGEKLAAKISAEFPEVRLVTYGENPRAQIRAEIFALHTRGAVFRLAWPTGARLVESPLLGHYNVSNVLAAIATAWGLGHAPSDMIGRLGTFDGVSGRMERVEAGHRFNVVVDYAHTDDALRHALEALRPITPGKLRVVFGCSGNRDRSARPLMVRAAQESADFVYATADNPRTESIGQIFQSMQAGVTAPRNIAWIEDRRAAIAAALAACEPGDCLLIAGKGHETTQQFADTEFPFDDRQVVRELLPTFSLQS